MGGDGTPRASTRVPRWAIALITVVAFALDLGTKQWALAALTPGEYHPLLGHLFGFELVFNPGAAFSFLTGATWVFTLIAVLVTGVIIRLSTRLHSWWWAIVLAMLLGGTIGNLTDRLFREPGVGVGHVVDFLNYNGFFVGNVADIFIVVGAIGMGILAFAGVPLEGHASPGEHPDG